MIIASSASFARVALLLIAGLAVLMQAAIPAGFMPGIGKQAGSFITICSGIDEKTVFVADEDGTHDQGADSACSYAFTLPALDQAPLPMQSVVATAFIVPVVTAPYQSHPLSHLNVSHPPTGPPVLI